MKKLSIVIAVIVVVCVGSITNWQKETKFHELNDNQNQGTTFIDLADKNGVAVIKAPKITFNAPKS